jgi:hypothetical protein
MSAPDTLALVEGATTFVAWAEAMHKGTRQ